jgi:hypothetical protein
VEERVRGLNEGAKALWREVLGLLRGDLDGAAGGL